MGIPSAGPNKAEVGDGTGGDSLPVMKYSKPLLGVSELVKDGVDDERGRTKVASLDPELSCWLRDSECV